jgi:hypothetical protein
MMIFDEIKQLEQQGWQALSDSNEAAQSFYSKVLHPECRMVFPGGLILNGRTEILDSFANRPWVEYEMDDEQVIQTQPDIAVMVYRITAHRQNSSPYRAAISSIYQRIDKRWQLIFHQQTPA